MGGIFHSNLMTYTNIFICESVKNKKYKHAATLGAQIMSKEWLVNSIKVNKFLSTSDLKLPFLQGLKVGIIGYGGDEFRQLVRFVFAEDCVLTIL
jgi:hypothetical protein